MPTPLLTISWTSRIACLFYELLITTAIVVVGVIIPYTLIGSFFHVAASGRVLMAHLMLVLLLYFAWQWVRGGQTLAMKTWRIKLVRADGGQISPSLAMLRYALAWISTLGLGLGFFWALVDRDKQYLHDRLSGTRLIRLPKD